MDFNDKAMWILVILAVVVIPLMGWGQYNFDKYTTPKEKCQTECHNFWGENTDWTCVKSCLEVK